MKALYEGSLADPGDRNPYAGQSLLLAKLWLRGYTRMLRVRVDTGPAMAAYLAALADANRVRGKQGAKHYPAAVREIASRHNRLALSPSSA